MRQTPTPHAKRGMIAFLLLAGLLLSSGGLTSLTAQEPGPATPSAQEPGPPPPTAQTMETVPSSAATGFLGQWTAILDTGHEIVEAHLSIYDDAGEVRAQVLMGNDPTADRIEKISVSGDAMTLSHTGTGDSANPYRVELVRRGDDLRVTTTVAHGDIILVGTATRNGP